MSDALQKLQFPAKLTEADLRKPLMLQTVLEYVDSLVKPGKALDADLLAEWFNQRVGEQISDVNEIFDDPAKTRQLFEVMTEDRPDAPDFSAGRQVESLAQAAGALGIAPGLKVADLKSKSREARQYLLTEVYAHDLPENPENFVNEELKRSGRDLRISGLAELVQPEILLQVLDVLDQDARSAPGAGAGQRLQRHARSLGVSNYVVLNALDERQVRVFLRACR